MFSLQNKVALITGASRGLGQAMALGLAAAGADIAGLGRTGGDTETQVQALGRRYHTIQCDLGQASPADLAQVVAEVVQVYGRLDILLNNAGTIRRAPVLEFSETDWDDVLQINLKTLFFLAQAAARQMVAQESGGKIINVASMLSFQGGILVPSYTAAKSGVAGLTKALANELAGHNINVNAIAPGYMVTDNTAALRADPVRNAAILQRIPAGRWGDPADLQGVAVFLASAAADYMHGAVVPVDGGWLCR